MNLELLTNKSKDNVEQLLTCLSIGNDTTDRIRNILIKAKNLYIIKDAEAKFGFVNFKYDAVKKVAYCPIHFNKDLSNIEIDEVVKRVMMLSRENNSDYIVLMDMFNKIDWGKYYRYNEPWDCFLSMRMEEYETIKEIIPQSEVTFRIDNLNYNDLLDLHKKSYQSEPVYVIGEWAQLLEQFLTNQDYMIVSCRLNDKLIGACIGYPYVDKHYIYSVCILPEHRGKQIGYKMLNYYLTHCESKVYHLHVLQSNTIACKLYEQLGFKNISKDNLVYKT